MADVDGFRNHGWYVFSSFWDMLTARLTSWSGYMADLAFYFVPDHGIAQGLNWRLMMGSAMIPAVIVCCLIPFCVESPRWYLTKNRHQDAYKAVCKLRYNKIQAARDLFYMQTLLKAEQEVITAGTRNRLKEFFTIRRNRNAMIASEIVMSVPPIPSPYWALGFATD